MPLDPRSINLHTTVTPGDAGQQALIGNWWKRPNYLNGGTDYLGGLVNFNPPAGQTDAERMGLFGSALRDASAWFRGQPQLAGSLDKAIAEQKQRIAQLQERAAAAGARRRRLTAGQ
jgi:hypothetical protein